MVRACARPGRWCGCGCVFLLRAGGSRHTQQKRRSWRCAAGTEAGRALAVQRRLPHWLRGGSAWSMDTMDAPGTEHDNPVATNDIERGNLSSSGDTAPQQNKTET
jgi:hypothetical protein